LRQAFFRFVQLNVRRRKWRRIYPFHR
jgi:hypothetical protein